MTILLTYRIIQTLPSELSPSIFSFLGFRKDWKTCRKHEADLISEYSLWTKRVLNDDALDWYFPGATVEFPIMFGQVELNNYLGWSLFGRWYLILLTRDNFYWHQTRELVHEPAFHMEEYQLWYEWEFLWLHNQNRRFK
jgi:hypothetical protein